MNDQAFQDWRDEANARPLLEVAQMFGAKLRRAGQESIGPCPYCAGSDRFSVNPTKGLWNCRGSNGGHDAIGLAMHCGSLSFLQACEQLAGRPNPTGAAARELSTAEKAERARALADARARELRQKAEQARYEDNTTKAAFAIWSAAKDMRNTIASDYLASRGIVLEQYPDSLRFHPALPYPNKIRKYPALVCRVDDVRGEFTAVWRIFLRDDGRKADVDRPKLGLGPSQGGCVRLNGIGPHIGVAEGVETALGAWLLTGRNFPVWSGLSTAIAIIEVPFEVNRVTVFPDGDRAIRRQGYEYVPSQPAGRRAAQALATRLATEGIGCTIAAEPPVGKDYNDLWLERQREVA